MAPTEKLPTKKVSRDYLGCKRKSISESMKISKLFVWCCIITLPAKAQYFYNDILLAGQNKIHFEKLAGSKIKTVTVKAYQNDGEEIDDFVLRQEVDKAAGTLTTYSKTTFSDASILKTTFNNLRMPVVVLDSAEGASTTTHYAYDDKERIISLSSYSVQSEQKENLVTETRQYVYNEKGMPEKMLRINGGTDTMTVIFSTAENGMPGEEAWFRNGQKIETWFYYYDEKNRLTDIVRYNAAAKKMLPDYLFGYDENNNLTSKVTVQPGTGQFRIWQYKYNAGGLKTEETVLNRQRQPEGRMVYFYD
jgi:YD repeat-containing protein